MFASTKCACSGVLIGVGVLRIYRARRRGSGQRNRKRCSTWARTGAHLHEERPAAIAVLTATYDGDDDDGGGDDGDDDGGDVRRRR